MPAIGKDDDTDEESIIYESEDDDQQGSDDNRLDSDNESLRRLSTHGHHLTFR